MGVFVISSFVALQDGKKVKGSKFVWLRESDRQVESSSRTNEKRGPSLDRYWNLFFAIKPVTFDVRGFMDEPTFRCGVFDFR